MGKLGVAITEAIVHEYGRAAFLQRISHPAWFQALGCVLGMDWHSSGITTSVLGALKRTVNERAHELGIYICGGKGKHSRETPAELQRIADATGLDGSALARNSRLTAKVDNTGIQDGYNIYLHSFILSADGDWAVIQQGMNDANGMARRYHWHSPAIRSFTEEPHTFIYGQQQGPILNITDRQAAGTRSGVLQLVQEPPEKLMSEIRKILMPRHHDVKRKDVDLKRLAGVLAVAHERRGPDMASLLLLEGLGPRTLRSLVLVSEVIHGTPSRFDDPARFSFAHGGKDGHPFPVPTIVYDEAIHTLRTAIERAKLGNTDKSDAIKGLSKAAQLLEKDIVPDNRRFEELIEQERKDSWKYGGRTVMGKALPPSAPVTASQLSLF
ncbi:DUF763 domain-containing protein [Nemorincola caseinilytica]|uniref:DUF763 domain-containing protein n=2 Tax=Nemorincola caseinilytica TaxID=2054315 RepID=A0ABP8NKQ2_9BACT